MKTLTKALVGTIAAGAMVIPAASPAFARDGHDRGGISTGDVVAGALVIGGIAAVASAASHNRSSDYNYDRAGYDRQDWGNRDGRNNGYDRGGYNMSPRDAVQLCTRAAMNAASRNSYGQARVTEIREVERNDRGYMVKGRIAVNAQGRDWQRGGYNDGRGGNGDYRYNDGRGYNDYNRGNDTGSFKCRVEYGRVTDINIGGLRRY